MTIHQGELTKVGRGARPTALGGKSRSRWGVILDPIQVGVRNVPAYSKDDLDGRPAQRRSESPALQ